MASTNPLVRKLSRFVPLGEDEVSALERLSRNCGSELAGQDLIYEGGKPEHIFLIMDGWAYRYKHLDNGRRQILAYLLPGDLCDVHVFIFEEMDHSIGLLCNAQVVRISPREILETMNRFPKIERAMWWATLVDEATLREWLLNVGQRNAIEKLSHLFCELSVRMRAVGLVNDDGSFPLPLNQYELADTTGLTAVHVNRTLQTLRKENLIKLARRKLTIPDFERLAETAAFNPNYLHIDGPPAEERLKERLRRLN